MSFDLIRSLRERFGRGGIKPPRAPSFFVANVDIDPVDDDGDGPDSDVVEEADLYGQSFGLVYQSADGTVTQRRVTVRRLARSTRNALLLRAYCWERQAPRTFRVDRIDTLYRLSSGEIIEDPATFLSRYATPEPVEDFTQSLLREASHGLRTLLFISRCDGEEALEEHEAMRWYVEQIAGDRRFSWDMFAKFLDTQHPDTFLVARALRQVARERSHAQALLGAAARLVDADGTITIDETRACEELVIMLDGAAAGRDDYYAASRS